MTSTHPFARTRQTPARILGLGSLGVALGVVLAASAPAGGTSAEVHPDKWPKAHSRGLVDPRTEGRISKLLAQMTLEEKVGQLIQADIEHIEPADLRNYPLGSVLAGADSGVHGDDIAQPATWLKLVREFRAVSMERRAGHVPIPILFGIDAVHGHNNLVGAVLYPHNIGLGAAHNPDLVRRIGVATAEEVAVTGIDWTFAPTLATPQDVRWGRSYEGYSQDPNLVRAYAPAVIEGLQGTAEQSGRLQTGHIAATAKHFLADGGTREGEDEGNAEIGEEELINIHAQGYPAAIDAGVFTVMASFSSWQGKKMHGNQSLLTTILKQRMGFDGFVIGDWNGHAQVPDCTKDDCAAALNAGVDMLMAPNGWKKLYENTLAEVRAGKIARGRVDDAVRRILRVKFQLGSFEEARPFEGKTELIGSAAHRALAREAVRESLVLLKNDGVLPIKGSLRVLVTGPAANDMGSASGGWTISWQGNRNTNANFPNGESIAAGIKAAVIAAGGTMVEDTDYFSAGTADVAIVVYGEDPYAEMLGDLKVPIYNSRAPLSQLQQLRRQGVRVVSVFLSGRPLWVNPEINASDAFVAAWLPGTEGGGIADLLIGDRAGKPRHDFTGQLSFAWPTTVAQFSSVSSGASREPIFRLGYGLRYGTGGVVPRLNERPDGL